MIWTVIRDRWVFVYSTYTAYLISVGLYYTVFVNDGSPEDAFFPIKSWLVVVLLVAAARILRPSFYVTFAAGWIIIQSGVTTLEFFKGPVWQLSPIPILTEEQMFMKIASASAAERFGALTFESSVLGAMAGLWSIFLLLNSVICFELRPRTASYPYGWLCVGGAVLGMCLVLGARSKSGLLLCTLALAALALFVLLTRQRGSIRLVAIGSITGIILLSILSFAAIKATRYGYYFDEEYDRVYQFFAVGPDKDAESGTDTRYSYAQIALGGLFYHPFGVGFSSGFSYAAPMLDKVYVTREMKDFFDAGVFRGYKSVIANEMMMGGLVSILVLTYSFYLIMRMSKGLRSDWSRRAAWVICPCLLIAGVVAELWPLWPSITFVYLWSIALGQDGWVPLTSSARCRGKCV